MHTAAAFIVMCCFAHTSSLTISRTGDPLLIHSSSAQSIPSAAVSKQLSSQIFPFHLADFKSDYSQNWNNPQHITSIHDSWKDNYGPIEASQIENNQKNTPVNNFFERKHFIWQSSPGVNNYQNIISYENKMPHPEEVMNYPAYVKKSTSSQGSSPNSISKQQKILIDNWPNQHLWQILSRSQNNRNIVTHQNLFPHLEGATNNWQKSHIWHSLPQNLDHNIIPQVKDVHYPSQVNQVYLTRSSPEILSGEGNTFIDNIQNHHILRLPSKNQDIQNIITHPYVIPHVEEEINQLSQAQQDRITGSQNKIFNNKDEILTNTLQSDHISQSFPQYQKEKLITHQNTIPQSEEVIKNLSQFQQDDITGSSPKLTNIEESILADNLYNDIFWQSLPQNQGHYNTITHHNIIPKTEEEVNHLSQIEHNHITGSLPNTILGNEEAILVDNLQNHYLEQILPDSQGDPNTITYHNIIPEVRQDHVIGSSPKELNDKETILPNYLQNHHIGQFLPENQADHNTITFQNTIPHVGVGINHLTQVQEDSNTGLSPTMLSNENNHIAQLLHLNQMDQNIDPQIVEIINYLSQIQQDNQYNSGSSTNILDDEDYILGDISRQLLTESLKNQNIMTYQNAIPQLVDAIDGSCHKQVSNSWVVPQYQQSLENYNEAVQEVTRHFTEDAISGKDGKNFRYIMMVHVVGGLAWEVAQNGWDKYNDTNSYTDLVKSLLEEAVVDPRGVVQKYGCVTDQVNDRISEILKLINHPVIRLVCQVIPSACNAAVYAVVHTQNDINLQEEADLLLSVGLAASVFQTSYNNAFNAISTQNIYLYLLNEGRSDIRRLVDVVSEVLDKLFADGQHLCPLHENY